MNQENHSIQKRIVVIDDHQIVVEGISSCLNDTNDLVVCGSASTLTNGMNVINELNPDAVILDLSLENGNGLDLMKAIMYEFPLLPVLILSMHEESMYAERAIRAGAKGYIMKNESFQKVADGLRQIMNGSLFVSEEVKQKLLLGISNQSKSLESLIKKLSDREFEVFKMVGQGYRPRNISEKMNISIKTVDTYFKRIREKLSAKSMEELIEISNNWLHQS